jgi:hypothetical protein
MLMPKEVRAPRGDRHLQADRATPRAPGTAEPKARNAIRALILLALGTVLTMLGNGILVILLAWRLRQGDQGNSPHQQGCSPWRSRFVYMGVQRRFRHGVANRLRRLCPLICWIGNSGTAPAGLGQADVLDYRGAVAAPVSFRARALRLAAHEHSVARRTLKACRYPPPRASGCLPSSTFATGRGSAHEEDDVGRFGGGGYRDRAGRRRDECQRGRGGQPDHELPARVRLHF